MAGWQAQTSVQTLAAATQFGDKRKGEIKDCCVGYFELFTKGNNPNSGQPMKRTKEEEKTIHRHCKAPSHGRTAKRDGNMRRLQRRVNQDGLAGKNLC